MGHPPGDEDMTSWHLDMGANLVPGGTAFRVWAPEAAGMELQLRLNDGCDRRLAMSSLSDGTWHLIVPGVGAGALYKFAPNGAEAYPDPYSRFQPNGVHGPSMVIDTSAFEWHDAGWHGIDRERLVVYEAHVGTVTPEGTFDGLVAQLDDLRDLGVTAVELMPVAQCSGGRNWGYDGVDLFAPSWSYGGPAGLQRLIDAAHQRGLGVILDVVYNHFGPEGNYLRAFSRQYFTDHYQTPWGDAVNYDGQGSAWVRKLAIDNALSWVHDFHVDGLRLDATFAIHDRSPRHLLQELSYAVRQSLPPDRPVVLIAETSENDARYFKPAAEGGFEFDLVWADDFHHAVHTHLTADRHGYFADYQGTAEEIARTIGQGFLYEGQTSSLTGEPRGTAARRWPAWRFLYCLQNHDQVGNRALGERLNQLVDLASYRAVSVLLLALPYSVLLFMGQELASSAPFLYFTDHEPDLGQLVTAGRRAEFASDPAFGPAEQVPDPQAQSTFDRSKLDPQQRRREPGSQVRQLYQELLALRSWNST